MTTTQDGLWRYQLGDVVTVVGFCPVDGQPVIGYSARRQYVFQRIYLLYSIMFLPPLLPPLSPSRPPSMGLRIAGEFITEKELSDAISAPDIRTALGCAVLEFTVAVDERKTPRAHGFFVEVDGVGVG